MCGLPSQAGTAWHAAALQALPARPFLRRLGRSVCACAAVAATEARLTLSHGQRGVRRGAHISARGAAAAVRWCTFFHAWRRERAARVAFRAAALRAPRPRACAPGYINVSFVCAAAPATAALALPSGGPGVGGGHGHGSARGPAAGVRSRRCCNTGCREPHINEARRADALRTPLPRTCGRHHGAAACVCAAAAETDARPPPLRTQSGRTGFGRALVRSAAVAIRCGAYSRTCSHRCPHRRRQGAADCVCGAAVATTARRLPSRG